MMTSFPIGLFFIFIIFFGFADRPTPHVGRFQPPAAASGSSRPPVRPKIQPEGQGIAEIVNRGRSQRLNGTIAAFPGPRRSYPSPRDFATAHMD